MAKIRSKQLNPKFSGSFSVSTGSFFVSGSDSPTTMGTYVLTTSGSITTQGTGRVYEQGNSVMDHATAMSIVFGG
jgi:hypothetical protein|tara:strand:- start:240 stop:464 length:225 start_codon:yes stop_codon:yes gene_type:complete